jgi:hypothetical protein
MALFGWFRRDKSRGAAQQSSQRTKPARDFSAAEVVPNSEGSCFAARELAGKRFLVRDVPKLPLADCNRPHCECRYRRHADRRAGPRRAADRGGVIGIDRPQVEGDRRSPTAFGRRSTDWHIPAAGGSGST